MAFKRAQIKNELTRWARLGSQGKSAMASADERVGNAWLRQPFLKGPAPQKSNELYPPVQNPQPVLVTFKGTMTSEEHQQPGRQTPEGKSQTTTGCAIPLNYERINKMQLCTHMTKPDVYERGRLVLAYLRHYKNGHVEGQTYTSARVKLRAQGFPNDDDKLQDVYFEFYKSQGVAENEINLDLTILRWHVETKKVMYHQAVARTQREQAPQAQKRKSAQGPCDPECNLI